MVATARGSDAHPPRAAYRAVHEVLPDDAPLAAATGRAPNAARCAAVWELWSDGEVAASAGPAYRVEEVLHWDDGPARDADASAGECIVFFFVRRRPDLSLATFAQRYREGHAPLARQHHPGIRRYVQNFVLGASPGAPEWHAIAQLHFASEHDLRERFYRDAGSPAVIAADVARFADTGSGLVLVARAGARESGA